MKKKWKFIGMMCAMFLTLMIGIKSEAAPQWYTVEGVVGGRIEFDPATGEIVDCGTSVTKAEIPEKIAGVKVTSIGDGAFGDCSDLTSITIPDSVTSIGNYAFSDCISLTNVTIPDSVTSIGDGAFGDCRDLTSITIPDSVTSIGERAFEYCSSLTNVTIPDSVTSIGDNAFLDCSSLTSITISDSMTSIGYHAFYGCSGLEKLVILASDTSFFRHFSDCAKLKSAGPIGSDCNIEYVYNENIPSGIFKGFTNLESVIIPEGVTDIEASAFYNCSNLTSVTISDSVMSIGGSAFSGCRSLTNVTIPAGIREIEEGVFLNCSSLGNVIIPAGVTSIGSNAFSGCSSLTSITIPEEVTSIGSNAFSGCSSLTSITIPKEVTSIGSNAFSGCSSLTSITIPEEVTSIGSNAFSGCSSLASITIPSSVTSIGGSAFSGCSSLASITIPSEVSSISANTFKDCSGLTSITISSSVKSIGGSAFSGCSSLTSITIPSSVTSIGGSAFSDCSSLTSMTIPSSVRSIGESAFSGCSGLTSIAIQAEVWSIGASTFKDCSGLTSITIPSSVRSIGESAFSGCSGLTSIAIPESVSSIKSGTFSGCSLLDHLTIPNGVSSIAEDAFEGCTKLKSLGPIGSECSIEYGWQSQIPASAFVNSSLNRVIIGNGVSSIGEKAFYGCTELEKLEISSGVINISDSAFRGCNSLKNVTIPEGVATIDSFAFFACSNLEKLIVPDSLKTIGTYAFGSCPKLCSAGAVGSECNIEYGWETQIPEKAFYMLSSLVHVTIPEGITEIGDKAFQGCSLNSVKIPNSLKEISAFNNMKELTSAGPVGSGCNIEYSWTEQIPENAFANFSLLTKVILPETITSIGENAFYNCEKLTDAGPVGSGSAIEYQWKKTIPTGFGSSLQTVILGTEITQITAESLPCKRLIVYNSDLSSFDFVDADTVTVISGFSGSTAESYARENQITFETLHTTEYVQIRAESCENVGIKRAAWYCEECDKYYTEIYHVNELQKDIVEILALGHSYEEKTTEPTCEAAGSIVYTCSTCQKSYTEEKEALGHSYKDVVIEPTCEEGGYTVHTCARCKNGYVDNETEALGHDYKGVVTEPTCEKGGYTTHTCSRCKDSYVDNETEALGHFYKEAVTEPTCEEKGYTTHTCDRCKKSFTDHETAVLGHSYKAVVTEPTCEEGGYTTHTCSRCKGSYVDNETEALGHSFTNYVSDNNAVPGAAGTKTAKCNRCDVTDTIEDPDSYIPKVDGVVRLAGKTRYETGYKVAEALKERLGVEKFDSVIIATGNNFADALAGSYLSACNNAPILLTDGKLDNILQLHTYIKENVTAGGTIYILGGESAVPVSVETISGYRICRLRGSSRYETNIEILKEAGISGNELIVATGKTFADSLSASATRLPILLVKPDTSLTEAQKGILRKVSGGTIYIIGGEGAVSAKIEKELAKYGSVERISGKGRYETSVNVAKTFFEEVHEVVFASGKNYPDGLCGGALASAMDAPLILTTDGKTAEAADYLQRMSVDSGYVLGGTGALSDESIVDIFDLTDADEIIVK